MKHLLQAAKNEIQGLRRENELLRAKVAVVDVFGAVVGLKNDGGLVARPDLCWELDRVVQDIEEKEKVEKPVLRPVEDSAPPQQPA